MASKKQIEANRKNAKKSTGPKTEEGKARSSLNAIKHGLTSRQVWLDEEDGERFRVFRHNLCGELETEGELEAALVFRLAAQLWRLARVPAIEAGLFERLRRDITGEDEGLAGAWLRDGSPYEGALARLARYESALDRSVARTLAELRKAQAERRRQQAQSRPISGERAEQIRAERDAWVEEAYAGTPLEYLVRGSREGKGNGNNTRGEAPRALRAANSQETEGLNGRGNRSS